MTTLAAAPRLLERSETVPLAATEYERLLGVVEALGPDDWVKPTDCPEWTVFDVVAHVVGIARWAASTPEMVRQLWAARDIKRPMPDKTNELEVRERRGRPPEQLIGELREVAGWTPGKRARLRGPVRRIPCPMSPTLKRPLDWLFTVCLTRDAWMHRIDICRATGAELVLTPEHDGRLVEDAVADWAGQHGQSYELVLTGPAGGRWQRGEGGERLELDAIEFCRALAGRASRPGLLDTEVPF